MSTPHSPSPKRSLPPILLASTSAARRDCLTRLGLAFDQDTPDIDEAPLDGETPKMLIERLARAKAHALVERYPGHLIIGSDQVCTIDQRPVGKPGNIEKARQQLLACSGQRVRFHTALAVYDGTQQRWLNEVEPFDVVFRTLSLAQINAYLTRERPFECAGSFRVEGPGIALFSALHGRDPNTLMGLPILLLCDMLSALGYEIISA